MAKPPTAAQANGVEYHDHRVRDGVPCQPWTVWVGSVPVAFASSLAEAERRYTRASIGTVGGAIARPDTFHCGGCRPLGG